jgi:hypothetical protein
MMTTRFSVTFFRPSKLPARLAALLGLLLLPGFLPALTRDFPEATLIRGKTASGYAYLNGGTSFDEQRVIERAGHLYNLKIVFARRAGTLTTPDFVIIGANNGRQVEKISLGAPWLYVQLPPGGYTILARFESHVVMLRDVNVGRAGRRTYVLRGE